MKKFIFVLICFFCIHIAAFAEANEKNDASEVIEEYSVIYGSEISKEMNGFENTDVQKLMPDFNAENMIAELAKGETTFSVGNIAEKVLLLLFGEIRNTVKLLVLIIAVSVLSTYLTNMQNSLQYSGAVNTAFFVCYLVVSGISATALMEVVNCGKVLIGNVSVFMRMLVPVLMVSLASGGAPVTATTFEVVMIGIIEVTQWIIESCFIPMLMMSAALGMVNNLSDSINAEKLVQFLNKSLKWGIGIAMTVFVGVMGIQGIVSGNADVLTVRVTKFATSNLIPVVGGALAETVETVIKCGVVIKNSVGVFGVIAIVLMTVTPLLKMSSCLVMFRLCSAILQPVSDKRIVKCLSDISDSVSSILGLTAVVMVMFVIMLTIVINVTT